MKSLNSSNQIGHFAIKEKPQHAQDVQRLVTLGFGLWWIDKFHGHDFLICFNEWNWCRLNPSVVQEAWKGFLALLRMDPKIQADNLVITYMYKKNMRYHARWHSCPSCRQTWPPQVNLTLIKKMAHAGLFYITHSKLFMKNMPWMNCMEN